MVSLSPEEVHRKCSEKGWVTMYERIATLTDEDRGRVLLVEDHPTPVGAEWVIRNYEATSPLVEKAWREGKRHFFLLRVGETSLNLESGVRAAGVESVEVRDGEVRVTHAGLAGAGVGAALSRGCAEGVSRVEIHEEGGGSRLGRATVVTPELRRLVIGVDDTDTEEEGATWSAVDVICHRLEDEAGVFYSRHVIVQLYPKTPHRTRNCAAVVVELGVPPKRVEKVKRKFLKMLKEVSFSDHTYAAFWDRLEFPKELRDLGDAAKRRIVSREEVDEVVEICEIEVVSIGDGERGRIGAVAALPFIDDHGLAARVPK